LEALHDKFPDAVFFTNGLDARLAQPEHNQWARNLVVASGFGLQLDPHLQKEIPPFRDARQTAYFLATQIALAKSLAYEKSISGNSILFSDSLVKIAGSENTAAIANQIKEPQLFELGRTKIFALNESPENCDELKICVHPKVDSFFSGTIPSGIFPGIALLFFALAYLKIPKEFLKHWAGCCYAAVIGSMGSAPLVAYALTGFIGFTKLDETASWKTFLLESAAYLGSGFVYIIVMFVIAYPRNKRTGTQWLESHLPRPLAELGFLPLSLVFIGLSLLAWFFWGADWLQNFHEPIALLEGVSLWPTLATQFLALVLAGYFIIEVFRIRHQFTVWLQDNFHLSHFSDANSLSEWGSGQTPPQENTAYPVLEAWLKWKASP
jgi:hypothetical protein